MNKWTSKQINVNKESNGKFRIDGDIYNVEKGDIVEIPAGIKFVFAGEMELLLIMNPKFNRDGEIVGEKNDLY